MNIDPIIDNDVSEISDDISYSKIPGEDLSLDPSLDSNDDDDEDSDDASDETSVHTNVYIDQIRDTAIELSQQNKELCSICLENFSKSTIELKDEEFCTPCNHKFHHDCIKKWFDKKDDCPLCKEILITNDLRQSCSKPLRNLDFNNSMDSITYILNLSSGCDLNLLLTKLKVIKRSYISVFRMTDLLISIFDCSILIPDNRIEQSKKDLNHFRYFDIRIIAIMIYIYVFIFGKYSSIDKLLIFADVIFRIMLIIRKHSFKNLKSIQSVINGKQYIILNMLTVPIHSIFILTWFLLTFNKERNLIIDYLRLNFYYSAISSLLKMTLIVIYGYDSIRDLIMKSGMLPLLQEPPPLQNSIGQNSIGQDPTQQIQGMLNNFTSLNNRPSIPAEQFLSTVNPQPIPTPTQANQNLPPSISTLISSQRQPRRRTNVTF